jgi:membrane protease YdiL (CAAX protease family)
MVNEPAPTQSPRWLTVLRNPLSRVVLYVLMLAAIGWPMVALLPSGPNSMTELLNLHPSAPALWVYALKSLIPIVLPYWFLVRLIERRKIDELAARGLLPNFLTGWLVGTTILVVAALAMALFGAYSIKGLNSGVNWLTPLLVLGLLPGITEEIMFRGVLFRVVEDGLGTWIALILSACFFGAVHIANPNATWWSSVAIAVEAGLLLGMAYAWTRSLWFVMGLHAAWNFTQGVLLGIPVSGVAIKGLLNSSTQGSVWLSGGEFGAEASVMSVFVCTVLTAFFARRAIMQKRIRPPFWRREKPQLPAVESAVAEADVVSFAD